MKIYGQTNEIVVREMTADDCGKFLELMTEHGKNEDFTVDDIKVLWQHRKKKGDIQCVITSIDGNTVFGFGGVVHKKLSVELFKKYVDKGYDEMSDKIIAEIGMKRRFVTGYKI